MLGEILLLLPACDNDDEIDIHVSFNVSKCAELYEKCKNIEMAHHVSSEG